MFAEESRELLELAENTLLQLEESPKDIELIGDLFRSVHTIKGAAGIFAFNDVVDFTHTAESVMGLIREQALDLDETLISLLLSARDHLATLVECALTDETMADADVDKGTRLLQQLGSYLSSNEAPEVAAEDDSTDGPDNDEKTEDDLAHVKRVENDYWHLSIRFSEEILQNGMEPISLLRYLGTVVEIHTITAVTDKLPTIEQLQPENCYLGFEVQFSTTSSKQEILDMLEFFVDECTIFILPPHGLLSDFIEMIEELPEENRRLGEILVSSGALTTQELQEALKTQEALNRQNLEAEESGKTPQATPKIGEILVDKGALPAPLVEAAIEKQQKVNDLKALNQQSIRINSHKLGQLIDLVGELVIASADVTSQAKGIENEILSQSSENLSRLVDEVRGVSLGLRMVQIGETFNRYKRIVRDLCKELGKQVILRIEGGETELDKTVVERISDPLMHMVRNAIDHGIESPEERLAAGKSEQATLHLRAFHESGSVVIEVSDDGRGLDRDKILEKARQKEIVRANAALSDSEVYRLIFEAGFSTAESVSNVSGRGVGMDVVRRNIHELRGQVSVDSAVGRGSKFTIRLPLTLAIIEGFQVNVGSASYIIPLNMVDECIELTSKLRASNHSDNYVSLRGEALPYVRLSDFFGQSAYDRELSANYQRDNIVVVQCGNKKTGLVVDELLGEQQAVIKPLGKIFQHLKCISGATILGGGDVAMIIDVPQLISAVH